MVDLRSRARARARALACALVFLLIMAIGAAAAPQPGTPGMDVRLSDDGGTNDGLFDGDDAGVGEFAAGIPPARGPMREQTTSSDVITGRIEDITGLPIAGARVTLENRNGDHLAHTYSDARGRFRFEALPPTAYLIVVEKPDYDTENQIIAASASGEPTLVPIVLTYNGNAVIGKKHAPWDINTSGPQYTGTADVEPFGSWYVEPWVYNERTPSQGTSTYYMPERIAFGLGHNFEIDFWQTIEINNAGYPTTPRGLHASDWGFGNAHIQLKYEWVADQDTYTPFAWPTISTSADLFIPTGNFTTDLRPDLYNTDQFSNGTVAEGLNVLLRKRFKPFEFYAEIGDVIADPTRVGPGYGFNNGIAQVPMGAYERMVDGNLVWFGAAFEHVLNSEYGLGYVLEFTGAAQSGSSLFFGSANAPSYSYLWAVPAVEFNWPNTGNLVMTWGFGVGLPIAQSNFPRTYTPTGTVTIYWNGGGPR